MGTLVAEHVPSMYAGLCECAAEGLHPFAFEYFSTYVTRGSTVLDLGSGEGAWSQRLHDNGYRVTGCDVNAPKRQVPFEFMAVDLNSNFAESFGSEKFDAISFIEVIEHLENPRQNFREIAKLVKLGGIVLVSTPNASGLYSRLRFFFTGQMAMFTDGAYGIGYGHITPLTAWQLEKVFMETGFTVQKRTFHDAPFFPPKCLGHVAKIFAWMFARPFMFGTVGGQSILYVLKKN